MWIEYNKTLINISKARSIVKSNQEIIIEFPKDDMGLYFKSQKETDDCWIYIKDKLAPKSFGSDKMPC